MNPMLPIPVLILVLMLLGLTLIVLEAVLPFGISLIVGALVMGFSVYLCFETYGPAAGVLYSLVALSLSIAAIYFILRQGFSVLGLKPPPPDPRPEGHSQEEEAGPPDGEVVEVVQVLRPTGTVEWRDHRYAARSLSPEQEIRRGSRVRVEGRDSIYLLVELVEAAPEPDPGPRIDPRPAR